MESKKTIQLFPKKRHMPPDLYQDVLNILRQELPYYESKNGRHPHYFVQDKDLERAASLVAQSVSND